MKNLLKYLLMMLLTWNLSSCESFIEGFERDPNNPDDAPSNKMIQGIMVADMFVHAGDLNRLTGMWMHHFTGMDRQYVAIDNWSGSQAADYDNTWGNFYSGVIAQARIAQDKATVENKIKIRGVAKVLEAHALGTVTALWGDVPNTEANNIKEFPNPSYDGQLSVYTYLQTLLTSAIADLGGAGSIPAVEDIFYGGVASNWIKLAHSLKARYFLHTGAYVSAETEAALGITDVEDELWAPFGDTFGANFNPYYDFMVYNRAGYMGADLAHAAELLDPDDNSGSGKYRGNDKTNEEARFNYTYLPYFEYYSSGYEPNYLNDFDWGAPNGKFGKEFPLLTAGESLLIIAEARIRQGDASGAISAYNNYRAYLRDGGNFRRFVEGVEECGGNTGAPDYCYFPLLTIKYDDYELADFETDGMVRHGRSSTTDAILYEILEERYVYFVGELEGFNDWRRTNNLIGVPIKTGSQIPERLLYPQVEVNSNKNIPTPIPGFFVPTAVNQ
jgi:starch-binding outer membrane protein, SusD/RagB family